MRRDEYLQRKRELDERLRAGVELLEAAHRAEVRALETLWAAQGFQGEPESPGSLAAAAVPEPPSSPLLPAQPHARRKARRDDWALRNEVVEALNRVPQEFDKNDVCRGLGYTPNRASLHRVFRDMVHEGALEVKEPGTGRLPTVYRKLPASPGPEE
ncbi:MAG: hypothetical protein JF614_25725 [Acidobacteria bacterium]|nr:hypothetical protein [Acidobacteriota bacterium]